jgi:hypothetical protein
MLRRRVSSALLRVPFTVADPQRAASLILRMKFDDGFVAYLNGTEVARRNAPDSVAFDSVATAAHPNVDAVEFEPIDLDAYRSLLLDGENVLAIHGLNLQFTDPDFLILPEIDVVVGGELSSEQSYYFSTATPGRPNGTGAATVISSLTHSPNSPSVDQSLAVSAVLEANASLPCDVRPGSGAANVR